MKRLSSQDSLIPICPSATHGHGDEKSAYPSMMMEGMDDEECGEEMCSVGQGSKKRRLSAEQVRALDKNFEVENKLDPERKVRLAHELGLQPRQVAVWFQNRRARWKTKQLERDYAALKSTYNSLRLDFDSLQHHNQSLLAEIKELKAKLGEEESYASGKEDAVASESDVKASDAEADEPPALIYGPSDSDSSAVLNDDASRYRHPLMLDDTAGAPSSGFQFWTSSCNAAAAAGSGGGVVPVFSFQHQLMKAEEHSYEEPCSSFFADEQPPSLPWCYQDQWSWANGGGDSKISGSEGSF